MKSTALRCSDRMIEELHSRQSVVIRFVRELAKDADVRRENGLFLCDGEKLLEEALRSGAEVSQVLWRETRSESFPAFSQEYLLKGELFDYASPMKNSPGPLFTVRMKTPDSAVKMNRVLILEELQDPGNVGTILRTADAFGVDAVILLEGCADVYAPKTVRASMGAVFRQPVLRMTETEAAELCRNQGLPLYGAALSDRAEDLRGLSLEHAAVAIGSEGHGLSRGLLDKCDGELIIPMCGAAESLNAAVAAAIVMWEMCRQEA